MITMIKQLLDMDWPNQMYFSLFLSAEFFVFLWCMIENGLFCFTVYMKKIFKKSKFIGIIMLFPIAFILFLFEFIPNIFSIIVRIIYAFFVYALDKNMTLQKSFKKRFSFDNLYS